MIKRIIGPEHKTKSEDNEHWPTLDTIAQVEATSEEMAHPIESGLLPNSESGWEAAQPGPQTVCLLFERPQRIKHVHLEFQEYQSARTQEFVLRWSSSGGRSYAEIVRQQYTFSPPDTTAERDDYSVDLDGMTNLQLTIIPEVSGGPARATLAQLCLA
jgi:hypothetical protein